MIIKLTKRFLKKIIDYVVAAVINQILDRFILQNKLESIQLALGKILSNQQININSLSLNDYEFKIFSQWGDDGIVQYLITNVSVENNIFIEFGVEDYEESCTRFLLMNNNWTGLVMDGSEIAVAKIRNSAYYWKYDLIAKHVFITKENINDVLTEFGFHNIGFLHIDIDGNDIYVFDALDLSRLNPSIISVEYNADFDFSRKISTPYRSDFNRTEAHYSNLFFGSSLGALAYIADVKGYALVGCDSHGCNAYFVRRDLLSNRVVEIDLSTAYRQAKFRQSRDKMGDLTHLSNVDRISLLKGLEIFNIETQKNEIL
jgi:hypothetical protein